MKPYILVNNVYLAKTSILLFTNHTNNSQRELINFRFHKCALFTANSLTASAAGSLAFLSIKTQAALITLHTTAKIRPWTLAQIFVSLNYCRPANNKSGLFHFVKGTTTISAKELLHRNRDVVFKFPESVFFALKKVQPCNCIAGKEWW